MDKGMSINDFNFTDIELEFKKEAVGSNYCILDRDQRAGKFIAHRVIECSPIFFSVLFMLIF